MKQRRISIKEILRNKVNRFHTEKEERERNCKLAENILSTDCYVEVLPNKIPKRYYKFIKTELSDLAKFFAILDKKESKITIVLKFNNHREFYFFEEIKRKNFLKYYEINKELIKIKPVSLSGLN
ncbi:MAG: hypothetical protein IJE05_00355 [Clostridia bacterium]|nr:hypothetical protein [Clostridia bacterium]